MRFTQEHKNKLSVAQKKRLIEGRNNTVFKKGHSFPEVIRKKMGSKLEKHYKWKGGITKDHKKYYSKWVEDNLEGVRKYAREWKRNHKVSIAVYCQNYRTRFKEAVGKFTPRQWEERKEEFGNVCAICGSKDNLTIDHIIPLSREGSNDISNIQPLCGHCNYSKQDRLMEEFLEYRKVKK